MNRLLALVAFLTLAGFLGILLWFVPRIDLGAVIVLTLAMAGYDFYLSMRRRRGGGRD